MAPSDLSSPSDGVPREPDCAENRVLLGRFLAGGLGGESGRRFRRHLVACPACRDVYRRALVSAARMGRALRRDRLDDRRSERRRRVRRRMIAAAAARGGRRFRLQVVLIPAALIVLLVHWGHRGGDPLSVEETAGELTVGGERLSQAALPRALQAGEWCVTGAGGGARIEGGGVRIVLGTSTRLLVEDAEEVRVRFQLGETEIDGDCTITSAFGIIALRGGAARLELREERLSLECTGGRILLSDPRGERELRSGERALGERGGFVVLAPPGATAEPG